MSILFSSILLWIFLFRIDKGSDKPYSSRGGGGEDAPQVEKIDPLEQSRLQTQAQLESIPQAAALQYQVKADPNTGLIPTTQLYEQARQEVFPEETRVREQLVQNILNELGSPTGLTPEQTSAQEAIRGRETGRLEESMRTRANLGGGLYGGRAAASEARSVGELGQRFAAEDVGREETRRLNNAKMAMSILQMLYPQSGIQAPSFINPVVSADTQFGTAAGQAGQQASLEQRQNESNQAMQSAMWSALGSAMPGFEFTKAL